MIRTTVLLHPLTGQPITPAGYRRNGDPIWPILGAAPDAAPDGDSDGDSDGDADPDADPDPDPDTGGDSDADPDGANQLGDAGKKALGEMKGKWRTERDKRKALEAQLADLKAGKPGDQGGGDQGDKPDAEAIRRQATTEATKAADARIIRAEVKAAAAGKLADPADAGRFLDLTKFELDDDGNVDADEIAEAIDELLKNKPYLAAQSGPARRFGGSADGGARNGSGKPKQLTNNDLKRMTAEQIVEAQDKGQLADLLGGKS
jgi:hypothetical protein